jgi:hypothetical protein
MKEPKKKKQRDPMIGIAIRFLLGTGMGFALVLLAFIFLMMALLSSAIDDASVPGWGWLLMALVSGSIGGFMMKRTLGGAPEPGTMK